MDDPLYNAPPYADGAGTVDFWLRARTDRPAWLTVADTLTTNAFPLRAGVSRVRLRAAYGGPVAVSLDPLPGALAELPGATNGLWLCDVSVEADRSNTVVFVGYDDHTYCSGLGCECDGGEHWIVGFDHEKVNTRNLTLIKTGVADEDTTDHCLGVLWQAGGKTNLFSLLDECCQTFANDLRFTSDNLTVNNKGELEFGGRPEDMEPHIALVKLHYSPHPEFDRVFDKLWVVVNSPTTRGRFNVWYTQNANIGWTTNLPSPFSRIVLTNTSHEATSIDPEPEAPGLWEHPYGICSYLHHNAKFEMRSERVGEHGHQATYDEPGVLIRTPIAAGTADFQAPYFAAGIPNGTRHREQDVYPFIRALQLDGNPVHRVSSLIGLGIVDVPENLTRPCIYKGANTHKYVERRPVLPTGTQ